MKLAPLRVRPMADASVLFADDRGRFFQGTEPFIDRLASDALTQEDRTFLRDNGFASDGADMLGQASHDHAVAQRLARAGPLDYLILVPTLRCNLSCSYCQVSRAPEHAKQFDWTDDTLAAVLEIIDGLEAKAVKIEFQGGEPTLRPDLIEAVIERCARFAERQFVICTNLSRLNNEILKLFDHPDVRISTSLDGDLQTHRAHRTVTDEATVRFAANLDLVLKRYGPGKVSALPTIDPTALPAPDHLIDAFADRGLTSIFLRPINFHGFARKRHQASQDHAAEWHNFHRAFVERIIQRNWTDRSRVLEETYLGLCLRRIFQPGHDRHVDLRNPNPLGRDYVVIDHDGRVYPTDEARMLARSGVIDLAIGDVFTGWASETRDILNRHSTNQFDRDCMRCTYQPYCGRDLVDDLARYGRVDLPRLETAFCRRHRELFDFAFELIYSDNPAVRFSLCRWLGLPADNVVLGDVAP